jgi:NAD(P)-dependent dehydrogenase (short-subunit alcohol dehydrogenase family)
MAVVFEICCRRDEWSYSQQRDSGVTLQGPLRRLGKPEEIVKITLFLSSAESSDIHGTTIVTDGEMVGYLPVGFPDLIAEMIKKKES